MATGRTSQRRECRSSLKKSGGSFPSDARAGDYGSLPLGIDSFSSRQVPPLRALLGVSVQARCVQTCDKGGPIMSRIESGQQQNCHAVPGVGWPRWTSTSEPQSCWSRVLVVPRAGPGNLVLWTSMREFNGDGCYAGIRLSRDAAMHAAALTNNHARIVRGALGRIVRAKQMHAS